MTTDHEIPPPHIHTPRDVRPTEASLLEEITELRALVASTEEAGAEARAILERQRDASNRLATARLDERDKERGLAVAHEAEAARLGEAASDNYVRSRCDNCETRTDHDEDGCCRTCGEDVIWPDDYIGRLEEELSEANELLARERQWRLSDAHDHTRLNAKLNEANETIRNQGAAVKALETEATTQKELTEHNFAAACLHEKESDKQRARADRAERLLGGAVRMAGRPPRWHETRRWAYVSEALATGSTEARKLCQQFGLDPDEMVNSTREADAKTTTEECRRLELDNDALRLQLEESK